MTVPGFDSTVVGNIPRDAPSVVCYCDLRYGFTLGEVRRQFPHLIAQRRVIALAASTDLCGQGVDTEPGNLGVQSAARSIKTRIDRGDWRPVGYADLSDMRRLISALHLLGVPTPPPGPGRPWRCYTAHPTGVEHICGPRTCGQLQVDADGTQWWWSSLQDPGGPDLDRNAFRDDFFPGARPAPPSPTPKGTIMVQTYLTADQRVGFVVETAGGEILHIEQKQPNGDFWRNDNGTPNWLSLGTPGKQAS